MRTIMTFAAFAIAAGIIIPRFATQANVSHPATPAMAAQTAASTTSAPPADSRSVMLSRNAQGHFQTDARVDGRRVTFMVDTGASVIALTADTAASLGIHPSPGEYTMLIRTANGTVRAAPTTLDMVEVGDIMVHDVAAVVMPDGALSDNLLGLSFLSRLRHFEYSDGKMVLEQ